MPKPHASGTPGIGKSGLLALVNRIHRLKSIPRTGWLDRGVKAEQVESVADHTTGVALLSWACAVQRQAEGAAIDPQRVLLLALWHDFPESDVGDLPPYDSAAIPPEDAPAARRAFLDRRHVRDRARTAQKREDEERAMRSLIEALPTPLREQIAGIWSELREGSSAEARFVKEVDCLETFLQSLRYLRDDRELPMGSFRKEAIETITSPLLRSVRDEAEREIGG